MLKERPVIPQPANALLKLLVGEVCIVFPVNSLEPLHLVLIERRLVEPSKIKAWAAIPRVVEPLRIGKIDAVARQLLPQPIWVEALVMI
jgi:hypothetical protein